MFRKMFVIVVSTLVLCPQVNAATINFSTPAGGTVWGISSTVLATGDTDVPGGDKIKVSFGYGVAGTEIIENHVIHTVIGAATGMNTWSASIVPPTSCWFVYFCTTAWKKSPFTSGPPPFVTKDHFVKAEALPVVPGVGSYRFDQGVF